MCREQLLERGKEFRTGSWVRVEWAAAGNDLFGEGEGAAGKGGFAHVHVADDPAVAAAFDPLKVTVRCIPMDGDDEPGTLSLIPLSEPTRP